MGGLGWVLLLASWVGLGWVCKLVGWVGLGEEKWTHVHLCVVVRYVGLRRALCERAIRASYSLTKATGEL
jgi:hypothetical protein